MNRMVLLLVTAISLSILTHTTVADSPHTVPNTPVWVIQIDGISRDAMFAAVAMQGLANRDAARVMVDPGDRNWATKFSRDSTRLAPQTLDKYPNASVFWMDYYHQTHGLVFEHVDHVGELFEKIKPHIQGVVLYDGKNPFEWVTALVIAAMEDAVPVTPQLLDHYPAIKQLPVIENIAGRFNNRLEATQWAWDHYQTQINPQAVFSVNNDMQIYAADIAIAQQMFAYQLGYMKGKTPAEAAMIHRILRKLKPLSPVWGWGGPNEHIYRDHVSRAGHYLMPTNAANASFHRHVPPLRERPFERAYTAPAAGEVTLQPKHYVTFIANEGDTYKAVHGLYNGGTWLEPERGEVPINWPLPPSLYDEYPAMLEYYYRTMSANDTFLPGPSGYGYCSIHLLPNRQTFLEAELATIPKMQVRFGEGWLAEHLPDKGQWLDARGLDGYIIEDAGEAYLEFTPKNRPIIGIDNKLFYWHHRFKGDTWQAIADGVVERIREIAGQHEPPFFIGVYAGSPHRFKYIADQLDPEQFEPVLGDMMIDLAAQAGQLRAQNRHITMEPGDSILVHATVRNINPDARIANIQAEPPEGWQISPTVWQSQSLAAQTGQDHATFTLTAPLSATPGTYHLQLRDTASKAHDRIRLTLLDPVAVKRHGTSHAQVISVGHGTITVDGNTEDWQGIDGDAIQHDLSGSGNGSLSATYRFAWDDNHLYGLIVSPLHASEPVEAASGHDYRTSSFWMVDTVAFWMDLNNDGQPKHGDLALWLGFSSEPQAGLYGLRANGRLAMSAPSGVETIATRQGDSRIIEFALPWNVAMQLLEQKRWPGGGESAITKGFRMGCEPLLIDGGDGQAFLNNLAGPAPSGYDTYSIDLELQSQ